MSNPFTKRKKNFMTVDELKELKKKIQLRNAELKLRTEQSRVENEFSNMNKGNGRMNFDSEKLKRGAIIVVSGLALTFIVIKIIGKFI